jgi:hypothetical protein
MMLKSDWLSQVFPDRARASHIDFNLDLMPDLQFGKNKTEKLPGET